MTNTGMRKNVAAFWPGWLNARLDMAFSLNTNYVKTVAEGMRQPYEMYDRMICFALLQPDMRAIFKLGPIDNDEWVALTQRLYGDCKTEEEFEACFAKLQNEQIAWYRKLWGAAGVVDGNS